SSIEAYAGPQPDCRRDISQECVGEVRRIGATGRARQVDGDGGGGGGAGTDRVGEVDGVAVGTALGDVLADFSERDGLRAAVDDGGGDAGGAERNAGAGCAGGRRWQRHGVVLAALDQVVEDGRQGKAKWRGGVEGGGEGQRASSSIEAYAGPQPDCRRDISKECVGEVRRIGATGRARQVDGDVDADGDAGTDRVGEVDGVAVGTALGDVLADFSERDGLRAAVDDGGGDAGGAERNAGAGCAGGRRWQRHGVVLAALDQVVEDGRQGKAKWRGGVEGGGEGQRASSSIHAHRRTAHR